MKWLVSLLVVVAAGSAAAAAYEKKVDCGLPAPLVVSCAETSGWTFDVRTIPSALDGVAEVEIGISRGDEALPPPFSASGSVPQEGIRYRWSSEDRDFGVSPTWAATVTSDLAHGMPLYSFFAQDEDNRLTLACTEARRSVAFMGGIREVTRNFDFSWSFFGGVEAPLRAYKVRLRLDRRKIPFFKTLRSAAEWIPAAAGFRTAVPPDAAYEPLYSTWYAFHRGVTAEDVERECAVAAKLGMKTVIVDDGWQIDDGNGYDWCGDFRPSKKCFPDMKGHVARIHALGMKYLLWYPVPLVGVDSENFVRFRGKYLREGRKGTAAVLDPRFPEVREFLCGLYERALKDWDIDGVKLDFIDSFRFSGRDPALAENYAGRDFKSVPDAVERLLTDVTTRMRAIRPDVLIEFRQSYVGPEIRRYGNMLRVVDCAGCMRKNRMGIANLRIVSPGSAVHSDMLEWHAGETVEDAAMYVLNCLFGVIQYSEALSRLPESHLRMLRHWVDFSVKHRPALLQGDFIPRAPEFGYPVLEGVSADERVIAVYDASRVVSAGAQDRLTLVVNATAGDGLVLELARPCRATFFNTFGDCVGSSDLAAGTVRVSVPRAGYAALSSVAGETVPAGVSEAGEVARVDFGVDTGRLRPELHASSYGPTIFGQSEEELADMKSMGFSWARTHDWARLNVNERVCDYFYIFPLMHLDAKDPSNYVFGPTDHLLGLAREKMGSQIFFRLGACGEGGAKSVHFNVLVPKDFAKVAETFAGTVRHYNRGWANGFRWNIRYWEIWNEPDGNANMWAPEGGLEGLEGPELEAKKEELKRQFIEFFVTSLRRLKEEFGDEIKVGGPALCGYHPWWFNPLLTACKEAGVAPDFISWHGYTDDPMKFVREAEEGRKLLDSYGFEKCEMIVNEWHYFGLDDYTWEDLGKQDPAVWKRIWTGPRSHNGIHSACFTLATLANLQRSMLDQAYFYGCRHTGYWGFKDERHVKYKVFPALRLFGNIIRDYTTMCASTSAGSLTTLAVRDASGRKALLVVDYGGKAPTVELTVKGVADGEKPRCVVLDEKHDLEPQAVSFAKGRLLIRKNDANSSAYFVTFEEQGPIGELKKK